uniref:Glutathione transferase n=1 Tax=Amphora coffeiformis TaxID=265554 RepID=A0A7S3P3Y1_9STRA|mmetsp:Transcript_11627/g.22283  ORF Transcript_11627/g.22283 Transcript_11627/m.22283 type:complete len:289 (+) Transcript_11627:20-886(+)|eukprot:scaffold4042_cov165-Amphora_coffeaeformis.AAC.7
MTSTVVSSLPTRFRYLSAWFCPFAHRATLALEHHRGRVEYEWVEALGWEQRADQTNVTGAGHEWWYHWKAEELKRTSPGALVPTLIPIDDKTGQPDESKSVFESIVTIEYIDQVSGATGKDRLISEDPFWYARSRYWADKVNRECCSTYYGVLVRKEETERKEHFQDLIKGLTHFSKQLETSSGPTFLPEGQLSNVDCTLIPWAFRYYVFEEYRGPEYKIPETQELKAYHEWFHHVMNLDSVKRTLPDKDRYLEHIAKYADGSARSKVANAVRRGVAAHEFDDDKDEY